MDETTKFGTRKEKLEAVKKEIESPGRAPPGYLVKAVVVKGGIRCSLVKIEEPE